MKERDELDIEISVLMRVARACVLTGSGKHCMTVILEIQASLFRAGEQCAGDLTVFGVVFFAF